MSAQKPTVASLAADVASLTEVVSALVGTLQGQPATDEATPAKRSRRGRKPAAAKSAGLTLAAGSTFEYLKGRKGSRKRWSTYQIVGAEDGRYLAVAAGSDSGFVSRWAPERVNESLPYVRNVKPA